MPGIGVVSLVWAAILLLPIVVAASVAYFSRASRLLAVAPAALMAWMLSWIQGFRLMAWQAVDSSRPHGMSFSYELNLLGIFCFWPATLVVLVVWGAANRWLSNRAARAQPVNPALQGTRDEALRPRA